MKQKNYLIFSIIVMVVLISTFFTITYFKQKEIQNKDILRLSDTVEIRKTTFSNCQQLLNTTLNFKGTVIFEECGKNCLGGCPNSGPDYCYYGIQNSNNCVVYLKSRIALRGDERFEGLEKTFNRFSIGQAVNINGNISLYYSYYCSAEEDVNRRKTPECSYFIIGDI